MAGPSGGNAATDGQRLFVGTSAINEVVGYGIAGETLKPVRVGRHGHQAERLELARRRQVLLQRGHIALAQPQALRVVGELLLNAVIDQQDRLAMQPRLIGRDRGVGEVGVTQVDVFRFRPVAQRIGQLQDGIQPGDQRHDDQYAK
jgi:hypothetical protein